MALRVMSYNILMGGEDRLPHIVNVIRGQQPDVVALMETNSRANAETLARELEMQLIFGEANNEFHVSWLSRLPLLRSQNHRLPELTKTLLEIELFWERRHVHLFATHLQSGRDAEHEWQRVEEMRAIIEIMRRAGDHLHLLVGDLNTLRPGDPTGVSQLPADIAEEKSKEVAHLPREVIPLLLAAGYIDCYRLMHPGAPGYTFKLPNFYLRLDYAFASPEMVLHLHSCDVVSNEEAKIASDHLPIVAEFW